MACVISSIPDRPEGLEIARVIAPEITHPIARSPKFRAAMRRTRSALRHA
jgi:hypothetical protein